MAKTYDFRIVVRRAQFARGLVTVPYGSSADVYHESCHELSYADAQVKLAELSAAEPRPHRAFLSMKYRDDRCPPGFKKAQNYVDRDGSEG